MAKSAISVRVEEDKIEELDKLANLNDRDRSFLINEAINMYLDVHNWQVQKINVGLKQAKNGKFASDKQVEKAILKWRN